MVDNLTQVIKTMYFGPPKLPFQESEAPIRGKFCMPRRHEVDTDGDMLPRHHTPGKIPKHIAIFVLSRTIVAVEVNMLLTQPVGLEEVV